ncbi:hypothetical protein N7454_003951 [Penicillium verhagenii]|nr:hypothetical protein N7454_003951 [Penicillium verhagenii]
MSLTRRTQEIGGGHCVEGYMAWRFDRENEVKHSGTLKSSDQGYLLFYQPEGSPQCTNPAPPKFTRPIKSKRQF